MTPDQSPRHSSVFTPGAPSDSPPQERTTVHIRSGPQVVVVGAGMAGLVSALLLAHAGAQVTVLEAQSQSGGKMRQLRPGPAQDWSDPHRAGIDSGPTVLTMKWLFEEIFASVGEHLDQALDLQRLEVLAKHAWSADSGQAQLSLYDHRAQSVQAVGEFAGAAEAKRFEHFCQSAQALYQALEGTIIREASPSLIKLTRSLGPRGLALLAGIGPMRSLWGSLGGYFKDQRLRQLFARYATYCGSSPWASPATLMLIAQVEMAGVWSVAGGMRALAQVLERLCRDRGVEFKFQTRCAELEIVGASVKAVHTDQAERLPASAVVFNGDIQALHDGLLGAAAAQGMSAKRQPGAVRSLSALTWSMQCVVEEKRFSLERHNVFFHNDRPLQYQDEFSDIFNRERLPLTPTVYVCAQERGVGAFTHSGEPGAKKESIFCLINAPANGDTRALTTQELKACESATFSLLQRCGLTLQTSPQWTLETTPRQFHQLFPATGGALYGQATHGWLQVFSRSTATTPIQGLFLAGGSVHPGPGLPMTAMSGRLAGEAAMAHLGLTKV